jgi:hypothetical protein
MVPFVTDSIWISPIARRDSTDYPARLPQLLAMTRRGIASSLGNRSAPR